MKTKTIEEVSKFEDFEKFCNSHEECEGCELSEEQTGSDKCEVEFWKNKFLLLKEGKPKRTISLEKYIQLQSYVCGEIFLAFDKPSISAENAKIQIDEVLKLNNVSVSDV